jgi:hypothetical protein
MPSTISKRVTKTTRVKHTVVRLKPAEVKKFRTTVPALLRWLKSIGAVPVTPDMKRRLIAAGEWGMPKE